MPRGLSRGECAPARSRFGSRIRSRCSTAPPRWSSRAGAHRLYHLLGAAAGKWRASPRLCRQTSGIQRGVPVANGDRARGKGGRICSRNAAIPGGIIDDAAPHRDGWVFCIHREPQDVILSARHLRRASKDEGLESRRRLDPLDLLRALAGVANLGSGPDGERAAKRLIDILIAGIQARS